MNDDLALMSIDDLLGMKAKIDGELKNRAAEELANMEKRREQLLLLVGTEKPPVDELAVRRTRNPGVAKYRNPADPTQTWTGRGKKPAWMAEAEDVEAFRIAA